jgi:hypothetical protein
MSKIVENDRNLLKDALAEYNAIKEEAIIVAKNRLAKSMPDVIEKFLKEELEKGLEMKEESMLNQEGGINAENGSQIDHMKNGDSGSKTIGESEEDDMELTEEDDMEDDEELTEYAIKEALAELEEGMYEEEEDVENLDEHDLELELDFNDKGLSIKGVSDGEDFDFEDMESDEEFEDEYELVDDESNDVDMEDEIEVDMEDESDDEDEMESEDDLDLDSLEDEEEDEIEDVKKEGLSHVISHQNARQVGSEGNLNYGKAERLRQESALKKDINKLIKENEELRSINLEFKDALKKYKTQLYEMAVFNANLSHVNNLFVEHTTTVNEKKEILNKFKSVATIEESKSVYNQFVSTLNESKKAKKTIEEMVQKPSVGGDSGSQKLNESLQSKEDDNIKAIKKMMKYIETRKK